jgi:sugar lactone lactonase YvrE
MSDAVEPHCVLEVRAKLGEAPTWRAKEDVLYWLDHLAPALHRFDPARNVDRVLGLGLDVQLGGIALTTAGDLVLFGRNGLSRVDPDRERSRRWLDPEAGQGDTCLNDGKPR